MRYGDTVAVDELSLTVETGSITALLGPNGAGKTTTIEVCEGFRPVQTGTVSILGTHPSDSSLRPRVGVMLQSGGTWTGVRTAEMLAHVAAFHANPLPLEPLIERLGMNDYLGTTYRRLSGGQQQTLSLAMSIVGRPELLFLDEPTAGLDPHARRNTWELLSELRESGVTIVLTTHFMDEAESLADRVHIVDAGRVIASGTPTELTRGPETEYVVTDLSETQRSAFIAWCSQHGLSLETRTRRGSLEQTFLELTGKQLR